MDSANIIDALERWVDLAVEAEYHLWDRTGSSPEPVDLPSRALPREFRHCTNAIVFWCDSGGCNVDPAPIIECATMLRHRYKARTAVVVDLFNPGEPTNQQILIALEKAARVCLRMRTVAASRVPVDSIRISKAELREIEDRGETNFRAWLDDQVRLGIVVEERRTSKFVTVVSPDLIKKIQGNPA